MLIHSATPTPLVLFNRISRNLECVNTSTTVVMRNSPRSCCSTATKTTGFFAIAAAIVVVSASAAGSIEEAETLSNIPQELSGECAGKKDCTKPRIQRPKSRKAESCTIKCVTTCIRGGEGSPGEGPLNLRRPLVVFKEGFRSRRYCLVECSDICNLIGDGDHGP